MPGKILIPDPKILLNDQTVGKEDRVEEERLCRHQGEGKYGTGPVVPDHVVKDVAQRGVVANRDFEFLFANL